MAQYVHTHPHNSTQSRSHSTIITKLSKDTMKVERYYENGQIKFTGNYQGMPDELKDKDIGDKFTDNNYETPNGARFGIARWWHDNGQLFTEGEHIDGLRQGIWVMYHSDGQVVEEGVYKDGKKVTWREKDMTFLNYDLTRRHIIRGNISLNDIHNLETDDIEQVKEWCEEELTNRKRV